MSLTARISRLASRQIIRDSVLSLIDQSFMAGCNFVTMVLAARSLGPSSFGLFALLFTAIGFAVLIQDSLITTPHTVIGATKTGMEYREYTSTVAVLQVALGMSTAGLFVLAAAVSTRVHADIVLTLVVSGFAAASFQLQDFTRRVLFVESRVSAVLLNDLVAYGTRVGLVVVLAAVLGLTVPRLLIILGATWLAGGMIGIWQIRGSLTRAYDRSVAGRHWTFGGWLVGSSVVSHVPAYVTAAVMSTVVSVGAFGAYRAFAQLLHVTNIPMNTLNRLIVPRLARDAEHGPARVRQTVTSILVPGSILLSVFAVIVLVMREPLLRHLYGAEYAEFAAVAILLVFRPLASFVAALQSHALAALRHTRALFAGRLIGSILGSVAGGAALVAFGMPAAGAGSLIASFSATVWWTRRWRAIARSSHRCAAHQHRVR